MLSNQILGKKNFPSSPTGLELVTFQNNGWNVLTTELYRGLVVSEVIYWVLMCDTCPAILMKRWPHCRRVFVQIINKGSIVTIS